MYTAAVIVSGFWEPNYMKILCEDMNKMLFTDKEPIKELCVYVVMIYHHLLSMY